MLRPVGRSLVDLASKSIVLILELHDCFPVGKPGCGLLPCTRLLSTLGCAGFCTTLLMAWRPLSKWLGMFWMDGRILLLNDSYTICSGSLPF